MIRRLIDLSVPVQDGPSEATPVDVTLLDHATAPAALGLQPDDFPDGTAISNETVTLTTHTGTHMDAPLHYGPHSGGRPAIAVDRIPLEWCFAPGVRLDLRHVPPGAGIAVTDIEEALARISHELQPGDIPLIWTGADRLWGTAAYRSEHPGMTRQSTAWLVERGARIIGIDSWGFDRPFASMVDDYRATGDNAALWPAHLYGREKAYCQLEKLANLEALPDYGFTVACFPVKLAGLGAAWTRVVAVIDSLLPVLYANARLDFERALKSRIVFAVEREPCQQPATVSLANGDGATGRSPCPEQLAAVPGVRLPSGSFLGQPLRTKGNGLFIPCGGFFEGPAWHLKAPIRNKISCSHSCQRNQK